MLIAPQATFSREGHKAIFCGTSPDNGPMRNMDCEKGQEDGQVCFGIKSTGGLARMIEA